MNHQFWLNQIKIKTNSSFVSWESSKLNGTRLVIKFKNELPMYVDLNGSIDNVNEQTYLKLLEQL